MYFGNAQMFTAPKAFMYCYIIDALMYLLCCNK